VVLPISDSTGSDVTMKYLKTLLDAHEQCHHNVPISDTGSQVNLPIQPGGSAVELISLLPASRSTQSRALPTRLIDVGVEGEPQVCIRTSISIRQHQGDTLSPGTLAIGYLALSHCWGTSEFLLMTDENKEMMFRGVAISQLAQTFQDAISVTRRLGYRYLWIDSLCIIQGSAEDWEREARTMKDVYSNAACVIAAISTWDSNESFFVDQNPLAASPCLVGVAGSGRGFLRGIYALPPMKYDDEAWDHDVRFSRLRSRAWCFQEEHLAKRIIYFGQHQVFFCCKTPSDTLQDFVASQAGTFPWNTENGMEHPSRIQKPTTKTGVRRAFAGAWHGSVSDWMDAIYIWGVDVLQRFPSPFTVRAGGLEEPSLPGNLLKERWWAAVTEYTSRYLSHESDRAAAVGGIAQYFDALEPTATYLSGLWGDEYLLMGLLWYVSHGAQASYTSSKKISLPSWSWLSVRGTIQNNSTTGSALPTASMATIKEIHRQTTQHQNGAEGEDVFGRTSSVKITIRGATQTATWQRYKRKHRHYYRGHRRPAEEVVTESHLAYYIPCTQDSSTGPEAVKLLDGDNKRVGWIVPDTLDEMPKVVTCLRIVVEPETQPMKDDFGIPWATRGLVLAATETEGQYRRVGYFELDKTMGSFLWPGVLSGQLSSRGAVLPIRRPGPDIDVNGFFDKCANRDICIV
jgi:hypothetical protein